MHPYTLSYLSKGEHISQSRIHKFVSFLEQEFGKMMKLKQQLAGLHFFLLFFLSFPGILQPVFVTTYCNFYHGTMANLYMSLVLSDCQPHSWCCTALQPGQISCASRARAHGQDTPAHLVSHTLLCAFHRKSTEVQKYTVFYTCISKEAEPPYSY